MILTLAPPENFCFLRLCNRVNEKLDIKLDIYSNVYV